MTVMRKLIYLCLLGLLFGAALAMPNRLALAHADLDHADPAIDAVLTTPPTGVQLWFTQELFRRQGLNKIEVYAADGSRQDQGDAAINDDDRTLLAVALKPDMAAGVYTVRWQAVSSEDGHESAGEFTFTIAAGNAATAAAASPTAVPTLAATDTSLPAATPTAATAPAATQSPTTGLPCLGGAAPLLLAVGVLWVSRWRGPRA